MNKRPDQGSVTGTSFFSHAHLQVIADDFGVGDTKERGLLAQLQSLVHIPQATPLRFLLKTVLIKRSLVIVAGCCKDGACPPEVSSTVVLQCKNIQSRRIGCLVEEKLTKQPREVLLTM